MLQETINNWKIFHSSCDPLEKWLNEGADVLERTSEEKMVSISMSFSLKYNKSIKFLLREFIFSYVRFRIINRRRKKEVDCLYIFAIFSSVISSVC
jgi:hypothetical protein